MRKLTEQDIAAIVGTSCESFTIEQARVKGGQYSDSDHYGIALGKSESGNYVTWWFHLEDEKPSFYWGHYFMENLEAAIQDYSTRE